MSKSLSIRQRHGDVRTGEANLKLDPIAGGSPSVMAGESALAEGGGSTGAALSKYCRLADSNYPSSPTGMAGRGVVVFTGSLTPFYSMTF